MCMFNFALFSVACAKKESRYYCTGYDSCDDADIGGHKRSGAKPADKIVYQQIDCGADDYAGNKDNKSRGEPFVFCALRNQIEYPHGNYADCIDRQREA